MIRNRAHLKRSARWLAASLVVLLAASAAQARDGRGRHGPPDPAQHAERLSEALDLTADQTANVQILFEAHVARVETLRESYDAQEIDRETLREALRADRESTHAQINSLLDDDQIAAFEALRQEREARRRSGGGPGHRSDRGERD